MCVSASACVSFAFSMALLSACPILVNVFYFILDAHLFLLREKERVWIWVGGWNLGGVGGGKLIIRIYYMGKHQLSI